MDNSLFIKKVCGLVSMGVLGIAIIVTAFVLGREDSKLETDSGKTTTTVTTTTSAVTTTVASESETITTTTVPSVSEESATTTTPTVTEDTDATTTATTTQKTPETTTTTTKKPADTTTKTTTTVTTTKKPETTTKKPSQSNGKLEISANISNSWDEGGKKCSQVDVVIKNNTGSAKDSWSAVLNFSKSIEVSNGWNGSFSANGSSLTVTPAEYNSKIEAGSEVTFGVIVSCDGDVTITSASV